MASFNIPVAALLLSLTISVSSTSAYATAAAAAVPSPRSAPSFDEPLYRFTVPKDEQDMDRQYLKAHMEAAAHTVEVFLESEVEKRLKDPAIVGSEKECLIVCREVYESAVDSLKTAIESVDSGNILKANFDVSAFTTYIDTCDECFKEFHELDDWAKAVGGDCLDKIVKYTN